MNKFQTDAPIVQPPKPPTYAEKQFLHTFSAGALLPLLQSTITAFVIFIVVFVIATLVFDAVDPFKPAGVIATLVWGFTWLSLQKRWLSLTRLEEIFNVDLNNDQVIGEPQVVKIQVTDVKESGHVEIHNIDLPTTPQKLSALAQGLLNGMSCSEKTWTGAGKPFSSPEFRSLRTEMLRRGILEYVSPKDPRQGIQLTKVGRAVMRHYSDLPSPTPPADDADAE